MKFIHLSDLHFHRKTKDNAGAVKVLKYVKETYPEHNLIVTGDIVDDGHEKQYKNAQKALKPFLGRVFISPGNHDFGALGNLYSRERAERFDEFLSAPLQQGGAFSGDGTPVVNVVKSDTDKVMLIALDTNLETSSAFDFACGAVGEEQMAALDTILRESASLGMTKILFFHHHPFVHNDPFMELQDALELMRTIYNRVDVVLFGHKHISGKLENVNGIRYVLASDNSPGKNFARELTVENGITSVDDIRII
ncbi:MAG: metallophosphoesterase [Kiritimatiellia bacterium]|jgi:3',5'-cyclic AMP phosphodiesterase CpdA|nr:metallophosphoesterase [Kiritimatiellia bacterium]